MRIRDPESDPDPDPMTDPDLDLYQLGVNQDQNSQYHSGCIRTRKTAGKTLKKFFLNFRLPVERQVVSYRVLPALVRCPVVGIVLRNVRIDS
jgi:hypothetical protein